MSACISEYEAIKSKRSTTFKTVKEFCLHHKFSHQNFMKIYHRYQQNPVEASLLPQKRGPRFKTRRTDLAIEQKVLELGQLGNNRYEIARILKSQAIEVSSSTIYPFLSKENIPLEMHKIRMAQKVNLLPVEERMQNMVEAGFNTFLLKNRDIFMDMLTDSGVNAMSQNQYAAMMLADDSYAGSETYYRLEAVLQDIFGMKHFLPAHQGRACENIIARTLVTPGSVALMNYHFTTTKAHIMLNGGSIESEHLAEMELVRLAVPRRVFTLSQVKYATDRIYWLYQNRQLIGGLEYVEEPKLLRFFFGLLKPIGNWPKLLTTQFRKDFGESL
jgi:hypothetical protein